jgi:hypothetical protein
MGGHLLVTFTISSQGRSSQVKQSALYMASQAPGTIGDAAQREAQRTFGTLAPDENMTDYLILRRDVESLVQSYYQSSQGVQVTIYAISPDSSDVRYLLSTTRDVVSGGKVTDQGLVDELNGLATKAREAQGDALEKASKVGEEELFLEGGRKDKSSVMLGYTVPLIASDGSCQAVAELSFQGETFFQHLMENFYSTLFTLGLIAIGIYLISDEVMHSGHAWLTYRSLRERGEESAHALLARPFLYLTNVASGIDTALAVVIAKEMLTKVRSRAFANAQNYGEQVTQYVNSLNSKEAFFNAIVNERAWEFGSEALRKFDLVRWNLYAKKIEETMRTMLCWGIAKNEDLLNDENVMKTYPEAINYVNWANKLWYKKVGKTNRKEDIKWYNEKYEIQLDDATMSSEGWQSVNWGSQMIKRTRTYIYKGTDYGTTTPAKVVNPDGTTTYTLGTAPNTATVTVAEGEETGITRKDVYAASDYATRLFRGYSNGALTGNGVAPYLIPINTETLTASSVLNNNGYRIMDTDSGDGVNVEVATIYKENYK